MFVDASALVAIILQEEGFELIEKALASSRSAFTTEFALMETGLAVMREAQRSAVETNEAMRGAVAALGISISPLSPEMILAALQANERYGKGRNHPAKLNMGDCLSYAAARVLGVPLLFKGADFARTDIRSALA